MHLRGHRHLPAGLAGGVRAAVHGASASASCWSAVRRRPAGRGPGLPVPPARDGGPRPPRRRARDGLRRPLRPLGRVPRRAHHRVRAARSRTGTWAVAREYPLHRPAGGVRPTTSPCWPSSAGDRGVGPRALRRQRHPARARRHPVLQRRRGAVLLRGHPRAQPPHRRAGAFRRGRAPSVCGRRPRPRRPRAARPAPTAGQAAPGADRSVAAGGAAPTTAGAPGAGTAVLRGGRGRRGRRHLAGRHQPAHPGAARRRAEPPVEQVGGLGVLVDAGVALGAHEADHEAPAAVVGRGHEGVPGGVGEPVLARRGRRGRSQQRVLVVHLEPRPGPDRRGSGSSAWPHLRRGRVGQQRAEHQREVYGEEVCPATSRPDAVRRRCRTRRASWRWRPSPPRRWAPPLARARALAASLPEPRTSAWNSSGTGYWPSFTRPTRVPSTPSSSLVAVTTGRRAPGEEREQHQRLQRAGRVVAAVRVPRGEHRAGAEVGDQPAGRVTPPGSGGAPAATRRRGCAAARRPPCCRPGPSGGRPARRRRVASAPRGRGRQRRSRPCGAASAARRAASSAAAAAACPAAVRRPPRRSCPAGTPSRRARRRLPAPALGRPGRPPRSA